MSNEYYDHTTYPEESSFGSSQTARAEYDLIEAGFDKLPPLSTTNSKVWQTNPTGTGGTATMTLTPSNGTFTLSNGKTFTVSASTTLSASSVVFEGGQTLSFSGAYTCAFTLTANTALTLPSSGTLVNTTGTVAKATNIVGGTSGQIPYQSATDTTAFYTPSGTGVPAMTSGATFTNPTFSSYTETVYSNGTGSSFSLSYANGGVQTLTTNGNTTITLPSPVSGKRIELAVTYGGAHTITFAGGGTIKYDTATAPIATSSSGKIDIYLITCFDGTNTIVRDGGRNF